MARVFTRWRSYGCSAHTLHSVARMLLSTCVDWMAKCPAGTRSAIARTGRQRVPAEPDTPRGTMASLVRTRAHTLRNYIHFIP